MRTSDRKPTVQFSSVEAAYQLAHDYAWGWFEYHAQQRLQLFNFGLIAIGATTAVCFSAFAQEWYKGAAFTGALIAFLAFVFLRLDGRNSDLTKFAEGYLRTGTEAALVPIVGVDIRLSGKADDHAARRFYTFGQIVRSVYYVTIVCAIIAAFAAMKLGAGWHYTGLW